MNVADMSTTRSQSELNESMSVKLNRLLDKLGASEKLRKVWIDSAAIQEILETIAFGLLKKHVSLYRFGSSAEGSTTVGLDSDYDNLYSRDNLPVVQNVTEIPRDEPLSLLVVKDNLSKPGYVKLQLVENGKPKTAKWTKFLYDDTWKVDRENRVVLCRDIPHSCFRDFYEIHGPAFTKTAIPGFKSEDHVFAVRCCSWPIDAKPWLSRNRTHGWPPPEAISQMSSLGFFLVPVGHPLSKESDKEWRISLSLQERLLMSSLNDTQYKCYVLLKILKKDLIEPYMGVESLSSYHLKTCLFYAIENTPSNDWNPKNLLLCLQNCLELVDRWLVEGTCPNYFVPEENMFEGRIYGPLKSKLHDVFKTLLSAKFGFLTQIRCDEIGKHMQMPFWPIPNTADIQTIISVFATEMRTINRLRNDILHNCYDQDINVCIRSLRKAAEYLAKIKTVTEHSKQQTGVAVNKILPQIELSLMSNIVAKVSHVTNDRNYSKDFLLRLLLSRKWQEISDNLDHFSPKLKQATFLGTLGYHEISLEILHQLEGLYSSLMMSVCKCKKMQIVLPRAMLLTLQEKDTSKDDLLRRYCPACVVFLPTETDLIPVPLQYEMRRSLGIPPGSRIEEEEFWFDWAVVDCCFLLYFLLYLNYRKLGMKEKAMSSIYMMETILTDRNMMNLGHRETALNLLAWVNLQEGHIEKAIGSLTLSLDIQPMHNAASYLRSFLS